MTRHPRKSVVLHTEIPLWMLRVALILAVLLVVGSWILALR